MLSLAETQLLTWLGPAVPYALPAFLAVWFFWLGGCIGSFLNVVIYRVPAGLNLFYPPSRCPKCEHPIRLSDNVPILGWVRLGGRCRDCGASISSRYPIVEAILAVTFAVVAGVEILADRPLADLALGRPSIPEMTVWIACLTHLGWLATAFSAGMIRRDGEYVSGWIWAPILIAATAVVAWEPRIQALPSSVGTALPELDGLIAVAVSGLLTVAFARLARFPADGRRDRPVSLGAAALGIAVGWHAAGILIILALAAQIASVLLSRATGARRPVGQTLTWFAVVAVGLTTLPLMEDAWSRLALTPAWAVWISYSAALLTGRIVLHLIDPVRGSTADPVRSSTADDSAGRTGITDNIDETEAIGRDGLVDGTTTDPVDIAEPTSSLAHASPDDMPSDGPLSPPGTQDGFVTPDENANLEAILASPSYRVAYKDIDFLHSPALRPVRLQLELLKVEMTLIEEGINSTIVVFGGTQVVERHAAERRVAAARAAVEAAPEEPLAKRELFRSERILAKSRFYDEAREFGRLASASYQADGKQKEYVVITGGGPGIMEAANRGAMDVGAKSIGLNIALPEEQDPNPYITPELCFQFHYFALRKMHFLLRAKALVVFPGGYGTLDELFEVLTLRQTGRMQPIPIILVGHEYWQNLVNFQYLADEGVIRDEHLELMEFAESALEAWKIIREFHEAPAQI